MTDPGDFDQRVTFGTREEVTDGAGNTRGGFVPQFTAWAGYTHLRGGETVMAGRLQGRHTQVVRVWASPNSRQVTTAWLLKDERTGETMNIRDVTPSKDRLCIDFLCETGVAH